MPRVEDRFSSAEAPFVLSDNLTVLAQDNPRGVDLQLDLTSNSSCLNAVFVSFEVDQAGSAHGDRLFTEPDEGLLQMRQQRLFLLELLPDRHLQVFRMPPPGFPDAAVLLRV